MSLLDPTSQIRVWVTVRVSIRIGVAVGVTVGWGTVRQGQVDV